MHHTINHYIIHVCINCTGISAFDDKNLTNHQYMVYYMNAYNHTCIYLTTNDSIVPQWLTSSINVSQFIIHTSHHMEWYIHLWCDVYMYSHMRNQKWVMPRHIMESAVLKMSHVSQGAVLGSESCHIGHLPNAWVIWSFLMYESFDIRHCSGMCHVI